MADIQQDGRARRQQDIFDLNRIKLINTAVDVINEVGDIREVTLTQIAKEAGVGVDKVELALSVADTVSLEQPVGEDGAQLGDFIQDEDASDPSLIVQDLDVAESLRDSISRLPEREGRILALRYGFYDGVPRTLEEIGEEFDLTRERIRQLEKLALCRLRHPSFGIREQDLV